MNILFIIMFERNAELLKFQTHPHISLQQLIEHGLKMSDMYIRLKFNGNFDPIRNHPGDGVGVLA